MRRARRLLALAGAFGPVTVLATGAAADEAPARQPVELTAPGPLDLLHGTLLPAGEGAPLVLIVPGSGPTDRDGNSPAGIRANSYRLLAEALSARGIATLRIDKRGLFASAGAIADPNRVTVADYAADARAWISAARVATGAHCVWLAGHSEGGLIALATGEGEGVCGFILLATPGRRLDMLIRDQIHASTADAGLLADADSALAALAAGRHVDVAGMAPGLAQLFNPAVQDYLIDLFHYDPAALAARSTGPMLVVQGLSDVQVTADDARALASARPDTRLVLLPGVNHVLKQVGDADRAANIRSYADRAMPVDGGVVDAIATFVTRRP